MRQAINSASEIIRRVSDGPIKPVYVIILQDCLKVLDVTLLEAPLFNRSLKRFYMLLNMCGVLDVPPKQPKNAAFIRSEANHLLGMLDEPTTP